MGFTFLLTALFLAFLVVWFVFRPLAEHLRENPEGAKALSDLLVPLFGKKTSEKHPGRSVARPNGQTSLDRK
jgi:hypothetical protein